MRVFVTGASGWIGSAVVPELMGAGHQVVGLARSSDSAAALIAAGAEVIEGSIDDLDAVRTGAADSDGVIHLAFRHDIAFAGDFETAAKSDHAAIEEIGAALEGSDRPLVIASGLAGLKPGQVSTERDMPEPTGPGSHRIAGAQLTLDLADRGVRSSVLRLSPTVHGDGDNGFVAMIVQAAKDKGVSAYVGDGSNRWPGVHRSDAARLFRLALTDAPAGSVLHASDEEGVPLREVAEVIGRHLDVPVKSVSPEEAGELFGFLAGFVAADWPSSSDLTRELLGWTPTGPGLIEDLEAGHYFR